ncbi:MAG TPA: tyrosine--tRNA ligase, partial [Rhodobiaceae bacterium]|nr:tyrosine--tRNA ligase [Rhodobiaceae bacterium]
NDAKKILATEATLMCHGSEAAEKAEATAQETFEGGGASVDLPTVNIDAAQLAEGLGLLEAFVIAGLAKSNGEARRLVQGGGAKVNDNAQDDIAAKLTETDVQGGRIKLSFGKKRHVLLRL